MSRNLILESCLVIFLTLSLRSYQKIYVPTLENILNDSGISDNSDTEYEVEPTSAISSEENCPIGEEQSTTEDTLTQNQTAEKKYVVEDICTNFIYSGSLNLNTMVDLWQTTYYRALEKVPCFKMFIRKLTMKEKQINKQKYGNFDDAVEWEDCNLELKSSMETKKHYLQGCERGHGVLENIIIGESNDSSTKFVMVPESPDQWLVVQNLLLMRDCDNGDIIVFSRVPHKPQNRVVVEALKKFGEKTTNGKFICGDQPPIKKKAIKIDEENEEST